MEVASQLVRGSETEGRTEQIFYRVERDLTRICAQDDAMQHIHT